MSILGKSGGVSDCTSLEGSECAKDHCINGLDLKDSSSILFTFDVPETIEIECNSVDVHGGPSRIEVVKPWLSEQKFLYLFRDATCQLQKNGCNGLVSLGIA